MITQKKERGRMNLSTVALILLAWQLLSSDSGRQPQKPTPQTNLTDILSDDVKQIINSAQKLSDGNCSQQDRAGAIFEIMANPAMQGLANSLFGRMGAEKAASDATQQPERTTNEQTQQTNKDSDVNSEGYRFQTPSAASQEFFKPIDNIADAEVKHKLYWFYDNWYNK